MIRYGFSPLEQYSKTGRIGPWTDIYSVCAVLYMAATSMEVPKATERAQHDTLIPLKRKRPDLSQDLNDIIMKSLSVDLEERYQSVGELEKALMYIGDYRKKMFDLWLVRFTLRKCIIYY
jgi:serine/threonine protein kinase